MEYGEMVLIEVDDFRSIVAEKGFNMREVTECMRGVYVNSDYLSKRLKKGSMPIDVLRAACEVINENPEDFIIEEEYDLSTVPTHQLMEELHRRAAI